MGRRKEKREKIHSISFKERVRQHPVLTAVFIVLRLSIVLIMVAQAFNRDYEAVFCCVMALFLMIVPTFIERNWHIALPDTLEIIVLFFIYAHEILGELRAYYINVPAWDTMLHTVAGFLLAAIGFSLCDIINRNENIKFNLSPLFLAIVAFCFSMTIAVCWEFFEFFADSLLRQDMQKDTWVSAINSTMLDPTKSNTIIHIKDIVGVDVRTASGQVWAFPAYLDIGIIDTIKDLFVNMIGAAVFSFIGFFYVKGRGKGWLARKFIPRLEKRIEEFEEEKSK